MIILKQIIPIMLFVILVSSSFISTPLFSKDISKGVNIDIARKHYSLESLKKIVQVIHKNNGNYIQLHFSDNENYAIESKFFKKNNETEDCLTKSEIRNLINYSNKLNIMVIPDIDLPSHAKAWLEYLKNENNNLYNDIISDYSDNTVDFLNNKKALDISKRQIKEILILFHQPQLKNKQKIVLGGDEVPGGVSHQKEFINFMNSLGNYVVKQGYEPQMWNDSITRNGLKTLSTSFSILYWQQKEYNDMEFSPTVEDFSNENFNVYNYNAYSLYFLPSPNFNKEDIQEQADYISWAYEYNKFNYIDNFYEKVDSQNVKGSMLTFWGENSSSMTQQEILEQEIPLIKQYFQKN